MAYGKPSSPPASDILTQKSFRMAHRAGRAHHCTNRTMLSSGRNDIFFSPADDEEISLSADPESAEIRDSPMNSLVASSRGEPPAEALEPSGSSKPEPPSQGSAGDAAGSESLELAEPVEEAAGTTEAGDDGAGSVGPDGAGELLGLGREDAEPALSAEEVAERLELGGEAPPAGLLEDGEAPGGTGEPEAEEAATESRAGGEEKEQAEEEEEEEGDVSALGQGEDRLQLRASAKRKSRPCSLPVSELETVIASACGDPETPRTHYIRIHTLLHSMPSAQGGASDEGPEEEATLQDASEKDGLSEADTLAAAPPPLEEDGEDPEGATPGTATPGHSGLTNGLVPDGDMLPSTGSESDSSPRQGGDHSCEGCDTPCCSPSCYSSSCYSSSCYSPSCYSGSRFASHTRFSSVDSAKVSESTVFSSQDDDDDDENSAFESVPDSVQSPELDPESANGAGPWHDDLATPAGSVARTVEGLESPVAGPSHRREG